MASDVTVLRAHQEWLGYVQPVGLVVSIPALQAAQAQVNRNIASDHASFVELLPRDAQGERIPTINDFPRFTQEVLRWEPNDLRGGPGADPAPSELEVALPEYHEVLRPTYAVPEYQPADPAKPWLLLVKCLPEGTEFDKLPTESSYWQASPHLKFERLLRELQTPIGLLTNGKALRLVYAPRGETSGHLTFSVAEMASVAGRPIFAALHMLLSAERLFSLPQRQRLPAILADSRKYQNVVSTKLAEQVLAALYELVRGFQAANEQRHGDLLRQVLADDPNQVYAGLLTVLMRLVFVLFAEDRDLLSSNAVYTNYYSVMGLFERLRADQGRYPDTMHQRYGAWAQLVTLFRLLYAGGRHGEFHLPARQGYLFDPERYPFLEGRAAGTAETVMPHVSDGVIFNVLRNLLILDGERLSYRTLDVEQIGSVYETTMGFALEIAAGRSIAIKPKKRHGAPATINLEGLLAAKPADRNKWLKERTDQELTGQALTALKAAQTVDDLLAGLDRKLAKNVTPNVVSKGSMIFRPSDERRRSGSHYTPRSLTEPIVRTTLRPILAQLGDQPTPEQILALKVCDPAMGSGAFLVEACRQLGDALVTAWHAHNCLPKLPPDEDELLHARRLVAQRCLYGVDRNVIAVDLAKLSLWLATLAKDHPFTFLDHSLRAGDSLVGLSRDQIAAFHWAPKPQRHILQQELTAQITKATEARRAILTAPESAPYTDRQQQLAVAEEALDRVRRLGDLVIAAFFGAEKPKAREQLLAEYLALAESARGARGEVVQVQRWLSILRELRGGERPITPFHWEVEFPEVFFESVKGESGFDAIVGNPPFAGRTTLSESNRDGYIDWLKESHAESHGNADLVAHFFRRVFTLLRAGGSFGLIATNTIGQGDTRSTGLRWICKHGGVIYNARRRYKWPGAAAVVVSVVHVGKGFGEEFAPAYQLDGRVVPTITAYLFHAGGHDDPLRLLSNKCKSFQGAVVVGMGFTFDDTSSDDVANPIRLMQELIAKDPRNAERIFPYIGGEEVNDSPSHAHHRYVINFGEMSEEDCRRGWPELMRIVEEKVKPERVASAKGGGVDRLKRGEFWWRFSRTAKELYDAIRGLDRVMVISQVTQHVAFAQLPNDMVYSHRLYVISVDTYQLFAALQSSLHDLWARFFGSSLEDRFMYAAADCFETFPFPPGVLDEDGASPLLESVGREYYEFRADLMVRNDEGLTKTYNRFHDPEEKSPDIVRLRELHAAMDRAVLAAYGWDDLAKTATCEFLLDYEDEDDDEEADLSPKKGKPKKKPWRYRWPDPFRDEVLARLLALNQQRAEEERLAGGATKSKASAKKAASTKPRSSKAVALPLPDLLEAQRDRDCILLLLQAWDRPLTRNALDQGLILIRNDPLRESLLKPGRPAITPESVRIVHGLDHVLQELEIQGRISKVPSDHQQILHITTLGKQLTPDEGDRRRLAEVKRIFEEGKSKGLVTVTPEAIDAKPDLVSA